MQRALGIFLLILGTVASLSASRAEAQIFVAIPDLSDAVCKMLCLSAGCQGNNAGKTVTCQTNSLPPITCSVACPAGSGGSGGSSPSSDPVVTSPAASVFQSGVPLAPSAGAPLP
jgi:hypothetical protein